MEAVITYLIRSSIWLTAFGLVYLLLLRNERFFVLNRLFLLTGLLSAIILPLITIRYSVTIVLPEASISTDPVSSEGVQAMAGNPISPEVILAGIIVSGSLFFLARILIQTLKVFHTISSSEVKKQNNLKVVKSGRFGHSFSFFSYIIVNPSSSEREVSEIVAHEAAHVRQYHWVDLVLAELLRTLQWFNPLAWLYGHFIRQNHEYLADRTALKTTSDPAVYKAILINQLLGGEAIRLGHSFSYSLNKKRFIMMKDTSIPVIRKMKLLIILPIASFIFYAFAEPNYTYQTNSDPVTATTVPPKKQEGKKVKGKVVQENGEALPGTSIIIVNSTTGTVSDMNGEFKLKDVPENAEIAFSFVGFKTVKKAADFNQNMVVVMKQDTVKKDLNLTIRPHRAKKSKENPMVILDGEKIPFESMNKISPESIESIEVLKDESAINKYGEEGKNGVIKITSKKQSSQEPEETIVEITATGNPDQASGEKSKKPVFFIVEDMPKFPGGDDALENYIASNLKYPETAKENRIQGKVYVSFIISTKGEVTNIKIAKGVDPSLNEEAKRVVSEMPDWIPGKQRGKNVAVNYTMPINFELGK